MGKTVKELKWEWERALDWRYRSTTGSPNHVLRFGWATAEIFFLLGESKGWREELGHMVGAWGTRTGLGGDVVLKLLARLRSRACVSFAGQAMVS